jgi:hypothetical protein
MNLFRGHRKDIPATWSVLWNLEDYYGSTMFERSRGSAEATYTA